MRVWVIPWLMLALAVVWAMRRLELRSRTEKQYDDNVANDHLRGEAPPTFSDGEGSRMPPSAS